MIVKSGKEELQTEIDGSIREKVWSTDDGGIIPSPLILMVSDRITQRSTQLGGEDKIHINTDRQTETLLLHTVTAGEGRSEMEMMRNDDEATSNGAARTWAWER